MDTVMHACVEDVCVARQAASDTACTAAQRTHATISLLAALRFLEALERYIQTELRRLDARDDVPQVPQRIKLEVQRRTRRTVPHLRTPAPRC